jgi:tetratricopeptide (TPR) repeat protein
MPVLQRMNRDPGSPLDRPTALEVAEREGIKAVVVGEISPVGEGYVLSARVLAAPDGSQLLALRETADNSSALIPAIDRLSGKLRERVGESLRTIRANEPLERVTTGSPDALRKYSQGVRAFAQGDYDRAVTLLQEATEIDTTFAMSYRKLAAALANAGAEQSRQSEAATMAYRYQERLPDIERYLAAAYYYWQVEYDAEQVRTAYHNVIDLQPDNVPALNNLAILSFETGEWSESEEYGLRAIDAASVGPAYTNTLLAQTAQGAMTRADSTLSRFEEESPNHPAALYLRATLTAAASDFEAADSLYVEFRAHLSTSPVWRSNAVNALAALAAIRGRPGDAERYTREEMTAAEARDRAADYLSGALDLGWLDLTYRNDPTAGVAKVEDALARHPLAPISPLDRPYLPLARFFAEAERLDRAKQLLGEYEQEVDEAFRANDRSLEFTRGRLALAEGRADEAITSIRESQAWFGCTGRCGSFDLAQAYELAGLDDSALVEYERVVTVAFLFRHLNDWQWRLAATYKRLGELYEERGERDKAIESYNNFVELWAEADEELQDQVRDVRSRISRLTSER